MTTQSTLGASTYDDALLVRGRKKSGSSSSALWGADNLLLVPCCRDPGDKLKNLSASPLFLSLAR
jgi:hypothetical protein